MTDAMSAAIVGGLIGAVAVVAGSWIAASFAYRFERRRATEIEEKQRAVLASAILQELLVVESNVDAMLAHPTLFSLRFERPPTPILDRVPESAHLFSGLTVNILSTFRVSVDNVAIRSQQLREELAEMRARGATAEEIEREFRHSKRLLELRAFRVYGSELDAYRALTTAGGRYEAHGGLTEEAERGAFAERLGTSGPDAAASLAAAHDRLTAAFADLDKPLTVPKSEFDMADSGDSPV